MLAPASNVIDEMAWWHFSRMSFTWKAMQAVHIWFIVTSRAQLSRTNGHRKRFALLSDDPPLGKPLGKYCPAASAALSATHCPRKPVLWYPWSCQHGSLLGWSETNTHTATRCLHSAQLAMHGWTERLNRLKEQSHTSVALKKCFSRVQPSTC
jgi:hypothetical protein